MPSIPQKNFPLELNYWAATCKILHSTHEGWVQNHGGGDNLLKKINEAGNRKENNPTPSQTKI